MKVFLNLSFLFFALLWSESLAGQEAIKDANETIANEVNILSLPEVIALALKKMNS